METPVGPVVGRRRLAVELRRLCVDAQLTIQVARALECSTGKISRSYSAGVRAGGSHFPGTASGQAEFRHVSVYRLDDAGN